MAQAEPPARTAPAASRDMIQRPHATLPACDHAAAAWTKAREMPADKLIEIHGAASHLFPSRDHGLTAMTTRLPPPQHAAGFVQAAPMQAPHVPVLLRAVIEHLAP